MYCFVTACLVLTVVGYAPLNTRLAHDDVRSVLITRTVAARVAQLIPRFFLSALVARNGAIKKVSVVYMHVAFSQAKCAPRPSHVSYGGHTLSVQPRIIPHRTILRLTAAVLGSR